MKNLGVVIKWLGVVGILAIAFLASFYLFALWLGGKMMGYQRFSWEGLFGYLSSQEFLIILVPSVIFYFLGTYLIKKNK